MAASTCGRDMPVWRSAMRTPRILRRWWSSRSFARRCSSVSANNSGMPSRSHCSTQSNLWRPRSGTSCASASHTGRYCDSCPPRMLSTGLTRFATTASNAPRSCGTHCKPPGVLTARTTCCSSACAAGRSGACGAGTATPVACSARCQSRRDGRSGVNAATAALACCISGAARSDPKSWLLSK